MIGEVRFDLNQIVAKMDKPKMLLSNFFGIEDDFNKIHFKDLYDFFDAYSPADCFVEPIFRNGVSSWKHNLYSRHITGQEMTINYAVDITQRVTRRDAEMDLFERAFLLLDDYLNPVEGYSEYTEKSAYYGVRNAATHSGTDYTDLPF